MIDRISDRLVSLLIIYKIAEESEFEIFKFGLNIYVRKKIHQFLFLLPAIILNKPIEILIFLVLFSIIRENCGGYHANTRTGCYMLSLTLSIGYLFLINILENRTELLRVIFLVSSGIIIILSHKGFYSRDFSINEIKRNRKRSRRTIFCLLIFDIFFAINNIFELHNAIYIVVIFNSFLITLDCVKMISIIYNNKF